MDKFAFKCRHCGHLESSGQAGERDFPASCRYCGHGVKFDPTTGIKSYDNEANWIVLGDLEGTELEDVLIFHGIAKSQVEKHTAAPSTSNREPQNISREAEENLGAEDKAE